MKERKGKLSYPSHKGPYGSRELRSFNLQLTLNVTDTK